MAKWINELGEYSDVVISSRVRLARNLDDYPFPFILSTEGAKEIIEKVEKAVCNNAGYKEFKLIELDKLDDNKKQVMVERHLISPNLVKKNEESAVITDDQEVLNVMLNEEDHIRIQCIYPGLNLQKAYELASDMDDVIENDLLYSFDDELGYLTACPTNIGTGLRASVMMHLPALVITGTIEKIFSAVNQIGFTVRGLYGEGSDAEGNLFQISNQITLGRSEEDIIKTLDNLTVQIINKEKEARAALLDKKKIQIEDKIFRSYGIMKNAKIMSSKEALERISDLRLGVGLGILKDIDNITLNRLMIDIQPAILQTIFQRQLNIYERDINRAKLIRERLTRK